MLLTRFSEGVHVLVRLSGKSRYFTAGTLTLARCGNLLGKTRVVHTRNLVILRGETNDTTACTSLRFL